LPRLRAATFGVRLAGLAAPLVVIYVAADVGSVTGGWISGALIKRGWSVNLGRKAALLAAALAIVPTMFAPAAGSMWMAVAIVSVAAAAHQWWSANLFTTVSDMFPRQAVASVIGIGGFGGAIAATPVAWAGGDLPASPGGHCPGLLPLAPPLRHANGCHWGRFVRTIVEVETDDGLIGLGEIGGGGESAVAAFHALKPYLVGHDPTRLEDLRFRIANPTASLYNP